MIFTINYVYHFIEDDFTANCAGFVADLRSELILQYLAARNPAE